MKTRVASHLANDFQSAADRMIESGADVAEVGDLFLVRDGSPEYEQRMKDYNGNPPIFLSFEHKGVIFCVSFD